MRRLEHILLVEDNQGDIEMTRRALRTSLPDCRVSVAHDGKAAMQVLTDLTGETAPQLIMADINMPGMDGKQFLDALKVSPDLKALPVVMFTSSQSPRDIRDCYERYASCYIAKPFDLQDFRKAIDQMIGFWHGLCQLPG